MKVRTVTGPAHWSSALINGDRSGLDPVEIASLDRWLAIELARGECVLGTIGDGERFTWHYAMYSHTPMAGGNVVDYLIGSD